MEDQAYKNLGIWNYDILSKEVVSYENPFTVLKAIAESLRLESEGQLQAYATMQVKQDNKHFYFDVYVSNGESKSTKSILRSDTLEEFKFYPLKIKLVDSNSSNDLSCDKEITSAIAYNNVGLEQIIKKMFSDYREDVNRILQKLAFDKIFRDFKNNR